LEKWGAVSGEIEQHKDPALEKLLKEHDISWSLQWEKVSNINWIDTEAQQIRQATLDADVIERYRASLEAGAIFPAVLAVRTGTSKIVLLGGIHRARAYEGEGRDALPAYVIPKDTSPALRYQLAIEHNAYHGMPLTQEERTVHALRLLDEYQLTQAEVARRVGLSPSFVSRIVQAREATKKARELGIEAQWYKLSPSSRWRVGMACIEDEEVFYEAVLVARNCRLSTMKCYEMATAIAAALRTGGKEEALLYLEDFEVENRPETSNGAGNGVPSPIGTFRRNAIQIMDLSLNAMVADCKATDAKATVDLVKRLALRCAELGTKLEAKAKVPA
jgi:transcriptional regulator with XRE-family HTH domain